MVPFWLKNENENACIFTASGEQEEIEILFPQKTYLGQQIRTRPLTGQGLCSQDKTSLPNSECFIKAFITYSAVCFFSEAEGQNATLPLSYLQSFLSPARTKAHRFSKPETVILLVIMKRREAQGVQNTQFGKKKMRKTNQIQDTHYFAQTLWMMFSEI